MNPKKRNLVLFILSMIAGMVYLTPLIRFSFYDQMIMALSITDIQLGDIAAIYGTFNVISYLPSGFLAEKFNTKKLLIVSTFGMFLVTIWYSTFPDYGSLMIIHALYGIFSVGTFWSPYLKAIRSLGSEEEQGRVFGISEGIRGMGQTAVAFACLGAFSLFSSYVAGFRVVLLINAAVFLLLMLAVIFLVPDFDKEMNAEQTPIQEKKNGLMVVFKTLKNPSTWICIFVILCGYTLWNTVNGYVGTYGTRVLNLSPELSSALSIVRSYIIVFVAGISGGFIMDKFSSKGKGMFFTFFLTGLSIVGVFLTSNIVFICIGITIVLSYLVNVLKSTYWSIMGEAGIPLAMTGMATGVISLIALTPDIFVTKVISRFIHYGESIGNVKLGFDLMLLWVAVWSVLGVVAATILKKKKERTDRNALT